MKPFNVKHVLEKLVNHYGLPAFLFNAESDNVFTLKTENKSVSFQLLPYAEYDKPQSSHEKHVFVYEDLWRSHEEVMASKISWYAGYHEKINARQCSVVKIQKTDAGAFLDRYHLMGYVSSAYNYGLIHQKQLSAVATFSKGRKMDRLPENKRSFELVRYAVLPGLSITGGLSKLLQFFMDEHAPGDIMTYVDPLLGDPVSFKRLGFQETGFTTPVKLYVDPKTHKRYFKAEKETGLITFRTLGNHKLVKFC